MYLLPGSDCGGTRDVRGVAPGLTGGLGGQPLLMYVLAASTLLGEKTVPSEYFSLVEY